MPDNSDDQIVVAGLCGSIRKGSFTRKALDVALQGARELGADTRLIDLNEYELLFCDGKEDESNYPADVERLRRTVGEAQGIILATPEYHGSYSGVLKNALDLMGFDEFEGKMLGLVGVSGGALGAIDAMNSLRGIGRALHAWVIPHQASVADDWKQFDDDGAIRDDSLAERVREVGRQVARFAYLHTSKESQEFLKTWEQAMPNPGAN